MVKPAVFLDVLGISAAFFFSDRIVIFFEVESGDLPGVCIEICRPAENGLGKGSYIEVLFAEDEGDKEGRFVYDHSPPAAESFDQRNPVLLDAGQVDQVLRRARDSHNDGAGRPLVDNAEGAVVAAQKGFFQLQLLEDGDVFKLDPVEIARMGNRRAP